MELKKQKIGYGELPDKQSIEELYKFKTLSEIAEYYGTTRTRVSRWCNKLGIEKNPRGGGNNRKILDNIDSIVSKEVLELYIKEKTNQEIAETLGCSRGSVATLFKHHGLKREYKKSEYTKYSRKVRLLTERTYTKNYKKLNPNNLPRTLCGVDGGYQLDHIKSVRYCFDSGISIEDCSSIDNLQMITWQENLGKRKF